MKWNDHQVSSATPGSLLSLLFHLTCIACRNGVLRPQHTTTTTTMEGGRTSSVLVLNDRISPVVFYYSLNMYGTTPFSLFNLILVLAGWIRR
jgi:hypothetical protein